MKSWLKVWYNALHMTAYQNGCLAICHPEEHGRFFTVLVIAEKGPYSGAKPGMRSFLLPIIREYGIIKRMGRGDSMIIFGIDPGYAIVGWGCIRYERARFTALEFGAVETPAGMDFSRRLEVIYEELNVLFARFKPDAISVEKLYFKNNQKTAIDVAQARGVILLAAQQNRIPLFEYTPLQVKSAVTGYGKAQKPQVMEMTRRLLGFKEVPKPDDAADALALAICHAQTGGTALKRRIVQGML